MGTAIALAQASRQCAATAVINRLKQQVVLATANAGEGHIASAFSIMDVLWVLYNEVLRIDPLNPTWAQRDRFILSKGHGGLGLYAILADRGFFPLAELEEFARRDSRLGGHPDCNKVPGVEASTGSLGHGFPIGVGVALGLRIRGVDSRVFVLVGDGECNEGSVWEAALLAAHHRLSNLICIVDHNHSTDRALLLGDISVKFAAFGWESVVIDGHDHVAINAALTRRPSERPFAIVAETVKGRGCRQMENNPAWHHRAPTASELPLILEELASKETP
jgi:transketolase